jgi:hypothetical protein
MIIPDAFNELCRHFHQDMALVDKSPEDAIASAVRSLNEEQKYVLRQFLDKLLEAPNALQQGRRAWRRSPAEIYFRKGEDLLAFLRSIRQAIEPVQKTP